MSKTKSKKKEFTVVVSYFEPSGKFYRSSSFRRAFRYTDGNVVNMSDVVAYLCGLRDSGGQGALPGLWPDMQNAGEGWEGFMFIDCLESRAEPRIILPPK